MIDLLEYFVYHIIPDGITTVRGALTVLVGGFVGLSFMALIMRVITRLKAFAFFGS